jgi:hypothetical protein
VEFRFNVEAEGGPRLLIAGYRHTLWMSSTEGFAVSATNEPTSQEHIPGPHDHSVPEIEFDETVAPRPEEEIADVLRAEPDVEDHSRHPE